jgi:hypothetical protein
MTELHLPTRNLGWVPADLEWVRTYEWRADMVSAAIIRIMDRQDNDFADSDCRNTVLTWAMERSVYAVLNTPGIFEKSNPPEHSADPSRILDAALELRIASESNGGPTIAFDPQWLMRVASHNSDVASSLLSCCGDEMPMFIRRVWLIDVLESMQNRPAKLSLSFGTLNCRSLRSQAVRNPECQQLIGLWLALEMDSETSNAARRNAVSMAAVEHSGLATTPIALILETYCPAVLSTWPVIRGLNLGIRAAAGIVQQQESPHGPSVLPALE